MNALQKVTKREDVAPAVMTIHSEPMDINHKEMDKEMILDEGLDHRIIGSNSLASPAKELEAFPVNPLEPTQELKVGEKLEGMMKEELKQFLWENTDIFAWKHSDMVGIDPYVACHALKEEVDKQLANGFIRKVVYPQWVSDLVLVRMSTKKWRVCIDFSKLNQACPKDSFPLPHINQLVDATTGHKLLSFMDTYSGYNQVLLFAKDEDHTSFITDRGLYCYRMIPFGLKNAGATYQQLVNRMFIGQIGNNMEVYVDNMLVKSVNVEDHIGHLRGMFGVLRKYRMKLNPLKCAFGVASEKFLGYMVNQREIEANPEKIQALIEMRSPSSPKKFHSLMESDFGLNLRRRPGAASCLLHTPKAEHLRKANEMARPERELKVFLSVLMATTSTALRLEFKASNNAAEYEALLLGLRLAQEIKASKL
ncbi:Ribonuclease H [Abeliophyllum distichum]|uniref:Ribonuclease H n=1 Tax=Abeliophyllum distichum TaxID=126358 RepID=A0ABD1SZP5_9LAMI